MSNSIHWKWSCRLNTLLGGDPTEPLCSRVYRQPDSVWRTIYFEIMDWRFKEIHHCARIYGEWRNT